MYKIRGTKVVSPYPTNLTPAETRLVFALQHHFAPENIFPDVYLPKVNYRTKFASDFTNLTLSSIQKKVTGSELVQIDCLTINEQGIFVFESKDYSGWIYGDETSKNWTEVLNFGNDKYTFYNPIKQNQLHIAALSDFLGADLPIYSIIVFSNDAEFKTRINTPEKCFIWHQSAVRSELKKFTECQLSLNQIKEIIERVIHHRIIPTGYTRATHIADIQN